MKKSFKTLLKTYPKRKRKRIKQLLGDYEYRADLYIHDFSAKILRKLNIEGKSRSDLANELNVSRSAITQLLNPTNISVKKMFELADAVGLTLEFQDLVEIDDCLLNSSETKLGVEPNTSDNNYTANVTHISKAKNLKMGTDYKEA